MDNKKGITLTELFNSILKRWYIIVATTVLGVGLAGLMAFFIVTPKFSSNAEVLVHVYKGGNVDNPDFLDTARLLDTVAYHFKSDIVLEDVIEKLDSPNLTPEKIRDGLSIKHSNTNFYIKITYTHPDKIFSELLTQQIIDSAAIVANEKLTTSMLENIFSVTSTPDVGIYASPNKLLYIIVGFLLGAIVGAGVVFIVEFGRYTYKNKEDIETDLNLQVIGIIPEYTVMESKKK